jgi:hypothetical protein
MKKKQTKKQQQKNKQKTTNKENNLTPSLCSFLLVEAVRRTSNSQ